MRPKPRRSGYTLIELAISMGSSVILMAGLCSVLFISSKALLPDATATDENNRSGLVASQLAADLRLALSFSERTARAVTFTVPDRDGDGQVEALRYSWTGMVGDPLLYQYNSNAAVTLASNVQQFNLAALTRVIPAGTLAPPPTMIEYKLFAEAKSSGAVTSLTVNAPPGVVAGNLLIAALAVDGNSAMSLAPPSGWSLLSRLNSGTSPSSSVGLGVWWRIATASEPSSYIFTGIPTKRAYGWIMQFSGADGNAPVLTTNAGSSSSPTCPINSTAVKNSMAVRVGAFDEDKIVAQDNTGISNHSTITMDSSDSSSSSASGGAAYVRLPSAGTTGTANFALTSNREFVTFTLVIAPADGG